MSTVLDSHSTKVAEETTPFTTTTIEDDQDQTDQNTIKLILHPGLPIY